MALDVTAIAVRGRWVKHTYPGSPPLPERDPPPDNRWQRGTGVDALYLADGEETAWAEWYRHLAERAIAPLAPSYLLTGAWLDVGAFAHLVSTTRPLRQVVHMLGSSTPRKHGLFKRDRYLVAGC